MILIIVLSKIYSKVMGQKYLRIKQILINKVSFLKNSSLRVTLEMREAIMLIILT